MQKVPFAISGKTRYAVDLAGFRVGHPYPASPGEAVWCSVPAVWFRRKNRLTAACVGYLHDLQREAPTDVGEFLARYQDGRYGGVCEGRWDGTRYWGAQEPEVIEAHLQLLRPMLMAYPEVPVSYDGWWVFEH